MRFLAVVILSLIATIISCSGESATRSVTVEEYAELVCADDSREGDTWGDSVRRIESQLKTLESINPPAELQDYYDASKDMAKAGLKLAKSKPQDETISLFEMMQESDLMALGIVLSAIEEELPPNIQKTLTEAGCN